MVDVVSYVIRIFTIALILLGLAIFLWPEYFKNRQTTVSDNYSCGFKDDVPFSTGNALLCYRGIPPGDIMSLNAGVSS